MSGDTSVDIVWEPPTQLSSLDCWDYSIELDCLRGPEDLHLAAELGKTLLERNKELENCIKLHQCTIDDQAQEIEYMKKEKAALREVNDSRLKIYEQLEVSIQDLERANQRLALENANDKKQIKNQCQTIDSLEARLDELQKKYDELKTENETFHRERQTKLQSLENASNPDDRTELLQDGSTHNTAVSPRRSSPDEDAARLQQLASTLASDEDVTKLLQQLSEARSQRAREQKRVTELKDQLDALLQEHASMEEQLNMWRAKAQDIKNLQDEINTLEEVRQGHLCGRCLRGTDARPYDELSVHLMDGGDEDDDLSLTESFAESIRDADTTLQDLSSKGDPLRGEDDDCVAMLSTGMGGKGESYRVLVDKYEALLRAHAESRRRPNQGMSLQEELQMSGEFGAGSVSPAASNSIRPLGTGGKKGATPTDFSEAETSSSGFSDEALSNKATQTEGRPGSLLCSIADGDDCRLSIYDDSSSFESRFHKTPEYRKLFSEIFEVLKRAAEAKDEGADLSLIEDDPQRMHSNGGYLEATPSEATDDNRSVASLAVSSVASEPVFRVHSPLLVKRDQHQQHHHQQQQENTSTPLRPLRNNTRRQPLEYLSVQVRKRGSAKKQQQSRRSNSPVDVLPSPNPRVRELRAGSRKKFRPLTQAEISDGINWNGSTAHFYPSNRSARSRMHQQQQQRDSGFGSPSQYRSGPGAAGGAGGGDYKPGSAAEEVARLRRLEMSYAEVLRMPNNGKPKPSRHRRNH